ncbi:MAG TPA: PRC-barrel domain-containing protein [Chloroflexota bacterium]
MEALAEAYAPDVELVSPSSRVVRIPIMRRWQSPVERSPRHTAVYLKEAHLSHDAERWIGRAVHDCTGRLLGRVDDLLMEERSLEETVAEGERATGWAARPLFAVVKAGGLSGGFGAKSVFVPIAELNEGDGQLRWKRHACYIRAVLGV